MTMPEAETAAEPAAPARTTNARRSGWVANLLYRYGVVLALALIPVYFSLKLPDTYFTLTNLQTILSTQAVLVVLTLGLTLALVVNEFDLSIGSAMVWSTTLLAVLTANRGWPLLPALGMCVLSGVVIGLVNATLVVRLKVNSFITTLGMGTVLIGLTSLISGSTLVSGVPRELVLAVSATRIAGLSLSVYYAFGLAVVLWWVYEYTPLGRRLYFTGLGPDAARLSGVKVDSLRMLALVGTSTIASLAGILEAGTLGGADPSAGPSVLLPAFAGAYLGATAIKPGRFNVWGTVIALYLLISGIVGLQLDGLSGWVTDVFNGGALVVAVTFAQIVSRRRSVRR